MIVLLGPPRTYSDCALDALKNPAFKKRRYTRTIGGVFGALRRREALFGFVPLFNTHAGAVKETERHIKTGVFEIVKKVSYPIRHCLAVSEARILKKDITVIYSHEQALSQCMASFKKYFPRAKLKTVSSTVAAMRKVKRLKTGRSAAVGSPEGAHAMKLFILMRNLQDQQKNKTIFALVRYHGRMRVL